MSPFDVHVIELNPKNDEHVRASTDSLIAMLTEQGMDVLHDDREATAGQKFADSDLIGIPMRVVVSEKTVAAKKFEVKDRKTGEVKYQAVAEIIGR